MSHSPHSAVIAVIDDDQSVLRSLEYLLESADYEVRLFTSPVSLLEGGSLPDIDCVISDVDMPGIDGFELVRLIQAERSALPVILITGYPDTLKRAPTLRGTKIRCFTKPFQGRELLAAVKEALGDHPVGGMDTP